MSYMSTSYTALSYTVNPPILPPPTVETEFGGSVAVFKTGSPTEQVRFLDFEIQRRGARGTDTAMVKLPKGVTVAENDIIEIILDLVNIKHLVGIYHFEYHGMDESGKGHDISLFNTTFGEGKYGRGLVSSGAGHGLILDHADFRFSGAFEINLWLKTTQSGGIGELIDKRSTSTDGYHVYLATTGKVGFTLFGNDIKSDAVVNDGVMHWVRFVRDENNLCTIDVDNVQQSATMNVVGAVVVSADIHVLEGFTGSNRFVGTIDVLRIYSDGYLTNTEATQLFECPYLTRTIKFGGHVWHINDDIHPIQVDCKSYGKELGEIEIKPTSANIFTNKTPEFIIESLIVGNTSLMFVNLATSSSVTTIDRFVAEGKLADLVTNLVNSVGKTFNTDGLGHFFLIDIGASYAPLKYEHGKKGATIYNTQEDDVEIINDLTLSGALTTYSTTELFSGNGSATQFTLQESPTTTKITVGSTVLKAERDYVVDTETNVITFTVAPASGTNNIQIDYDYEAPIVVRGQRKNSINKIGRRDSKMSVPWIRTVGDGIRLTQNYLSLFSDIKPQYQLKVSKLSPELDENLSVQLVNPHKSIDGPYVVKELSYRFKDAKTVVSLGEYVHDQYELHKQTIQKLHSLESIVSPVRKIRDYKSMEETLALTDVVISKLAADALLTETDTITTLADSVIMQGGYNHAVYNSKSGYNIAPY